MKKLLRRQARPAGSVLVITLVLTGILGLTLAGYLHRVRTQNLLVAQSQAWNTALALAEAGIEEGMAQINVAFGTNYLPSIQTNWSNGGGYYGPRAGTLPSGSYSVIVIPTNPGPTLIATGYAEVPLLGKPVIRVVQVTTTTLSAFGVGMAAQRDITMNGNNILVDSFDSADSLHSTNGMYYYPWRKAGGDIASAFGLVGVNNANVNGKVRTGPNGSYGIRSGGLVGDLNWTGPGVQEGWYADDFNMEFKPVTPPPTDSYVQPTGIVGDTNKYVLGSGGYKVSGDLILQAGETMLVTGNAILYVGGDFIMRGGTTGSAINIAPGASLKIYVAGTIASFTQVNTSGNATTFQYYGLPSNTMLAWSGNDTFVGTIYAPQANFVLGGGGSTVYDFQGSCVVNSVVMNGHFNFHYDENLKRIGPLVGFVVSSWKEL